MDERHPSGEWEVEQCEECGFDSGRWNVHDTDSLMAGLGFWWRHATDSVPTAALIARPEGGVWSALEYGLHSALVTAINRAGIEMILAEDGVALPSPPDLGDGIGDDDRPLELDAGRVVSDLEREGDALAVLARRTPPRAWAHLGRLGEQELAAGWLLFHAVHDATHHMMDVARGLAVLGAGTVMATGSVDQLNVSHGGVPKLPVSVADVTRSGLAGDVQQSKRHHGRPFQALCLWSSEVIAGLAEEGHPIGAGFAGENVTISGLDWTALRPGTRLLIGTVVAELSFPATPCTKQRGWFSDGDFARIDFDVDPARTRWYAWVRQPGRIETGDSVAQAT